MRYLDLIREELDRLSGPNPSRTCKMTGEKIPLEMTEILDLWGREAIQRGTLIYLTEKATIH